MTPTAITARNQTIKRRRECHFNFTPTAASSNTTNPTYVVRSAAPLRSAMSVPRRYTASNDNAPASCGESLARAVPSVNVSAGSQAAADLFQPLDVILSFDGQPVGSLTPLNAFYAKATVGQTIRVGIYRSQTDQNLTLTR